MNKRTIVQQTILAAESAIIGLQNGQKVDTNSIDKWTEGLLRYVLNDNQGIYNPDPFERTQAQYIENIQFKLDDNNFTVNEKINTLTKFMAAIWEATYKRPDLDDDIIWEPIFDRN